MTWGLALSGGMACGLANAGVLDVLDRELGKPDCIAGSSMGAIVAALYALGHPPSVLDDLAASIKLPEVARLSPKPLKHGLHGGLLRQELERALGPVIGDAKIADCRIPFVCIAGRVKEPIRWERIMKDGFTDYVEGCIEKHVFPQETRIMDALLATSAVPVIFSPVVLGGDTFVDLCDYGAVPARTLRETLHPDIVIGTKTVPDFGWAEKLLPSSWKEFLAAGRASVEESAAACDLVIVPEMPSQFFRFDKASAFVEAGRKAAERKLPEVLRLLR